LEEPPGSIELNENTKLFGSTNKLVWFSIWLGNKFVLLFWPTLALLMRPCERCPEERTTFGVLSPASIGRKKFALALSLKAFIEKT
jgi:hypothetical protein